MNAISACENRQQPVPENEVNIINSREIEPLLSKARQVLMYYEKATGCSAVVVDKSGQAIKTHDYKKQMRFCDFCRKNFHNPLQIWKGNEYPCEKVHLAALAESRRTGRVHIYSCAAGFVYWTKPLYRNRRYAGALIAGQVLAGGREETVEKFSAVCKDRAAA
jgi:ligand-binding sensor protein